MFELKTEFLRMATRQRRSDRAGVTRDHHIHRAPYAVAQGSTIEILRSAKWRTFRVASVARRASTIPAIWVSRISTGRPLFCRAAASDAAAVAAALSKSNTRSSRSSFSKSNADSSACRRRPDGSKARPETRLEQSDAGIHTDSAGWRSSHATTAGSGPARINAPSTLVSRIIT